MPPPKKLYVAIIGTGLVGTELISQIVSLPRGSSPFQIVSLSSSKRTLFLDPASSSSPITQESWKSLLASSSSPPDFPALTTSLASLVSQEAGVAIVDNTSSNDVARLYPNWLEKGIHVVTPNKKAFSGDVALYDKIVDAGRKHGGGRWLNEATVGAGLPVVSTLRELVLTGDKVCFPLQTLDLS
jgi:homoserine dehydrogenase